VTALRAARRRVGKGGPARVHAKHFLRHPLATDKTISTKYNYYDTIFPSGMFFAINGIMKHDDPENRLFRGKFPLFACRKFPVIEKTGNLCASY
jgi:hypothetical protein